MKASICLLLVAYAAFAAAKPKVVSSNRASECSQEGLLAMSTSCPPAEMEDVQEFSTCVAEHTVNFMVSCSEETSPFATLVKECYAPKFQEELDSPDACFKKLTTTLEIVLCAADKFNGIYEICGDGIDTVA